jgi:hypothetical protein
VSAEVSVSYPAASSATAEAVRLATSISERPAVFFDGYTEHPIEAGRALLAVANVATRRFHEPATMVAARIRAADPVVTAEPDRLRFESFSQCAGAHARFDLVEAGLDVRTCVPGTTNVDFNEPVRAALAGLTRHEPLRLTVGWDSLVVQTVDDTVVERRVPLPERWVKGFGEVQIALTGAPPLLDLDHVRAQRFLNGLPGGRAGGATAWAVAAGGAVRIGQSWRPGAVCLAGASRLRALLPLARFATGLRAYAHPDTKEPTAVAWVLTLPGGRVTLTLSPEPNRGFSGEGGLLLNLVDARAQNDAAALGRTLATRARFSVSEAADAGNVTPRRVATALTWLGLYGHLGFDVTDQVYFWRHLPYPDDILRAEPPRLRDARALAADGAVTRASDGEWRVTSGGAEYRASISADGFACTCPWGARHRTARGPCKHVLAGALVNASQEGPAVGGRGLVPSVLGASAISDA